MMTAYTCEQVISDCERALCQLTLCFELQSASESRKGRISNKYCSAMQ